jgi:hypothetical protein
MFSLFGRTTSNEARGTAGYRLGAGGSRVSDVFASLEAKAFDGFVENSLPRKEGNLPSSIGVRLGEGPAGSCGQGSISTEKSYMFRP